MANRYTREVRHEGLGKYRVISGTDSYIVAAKAEALMYEWEQKYQLIVAVRKDKQWALEQKQMFLQNKEKKKDEFEQKLHYAEERTNAAQEEIALIRNILKTGLESPGEINWDKLKIQAPFTNPEPKPPRYINYPQEPKLTDDLYQPGLNIRGPNSAQATYLALPNAPDRAHPKYQPDIKLIDKIIKSKMEEKLLEAEAIYNFDCKAWEEKVEQINLENQSRANELFKKDYDEWVQNVDYVRKTNEEAYKSNVEEVESWNRASAEYNSKVEANIAATDDLRARYESHQASGIEDYGALLLALSHYSEGFQQDCDIEYNPATKILILEYALPAPEHMPRLSEVKYIKSKNIFNECFLSESELNKLYDDGLYQICLRVLFELFHADVINAISAICLNGWVKSIDKSTGKEATACVLTIQVKADEFTAINLENVDPKACFKALKGIGSSKLHSLTPVAPVLTISREDKRFVTSHEVESQLNEGFNLAAMDWEDFEHLIRQLFEEEFRQAGGEVKVTQASRDGGVDAIAFDPDVIRGGKTVIQAKRYTNTVGVSAVRDLYGTVLNEGASKGILVTTSDYGPDSYEFAKGKPLVLLSGGNLLSLLAKHGHKAKIDLKEAKTILAS